MQTPAILNVSTPASSPASTSRQAAGASGGGFNQMLSQQIADRREADKPAQPRAAGQAGKSESKPAEAKQTGAKQPESTQANGAANASAASKSPESEEQSDEATAIAPTATELMTQVAAALLLPQAATEATATTGDAIAAVNGAAVAREAGLLTGAAAKEQLPGATGDRGDFLAALRQAAEPQDTSLQAAIVDAAASGSEQLAETLPELAGATGLQDTTPVTTAGAAMQPGALSASQAAGAEAADRLAPRFGSPAWDQALGQKVVWMVAGAQQSASLTLNPPDLGPLQVVLNVSNGQADASFFSAQPEVRQALEAALPRLRDMMTEAGVELGQTSISAGMPDRHDQPGSQAAHKSAGGAGTGNGNGDAEASAAPAVRADRPIGGQGLVDTFA